MKDGFDKNVAEKMPKFQKMRQNRPWNINPVQMPSKVDETEDATVTERGRIDEPKSPFAAKTDKEHEPLNLIPTKITPERGPIELKHTERTIKEIDSQFTNMLIESKETRRTLENKDNELKDALSLNRQLKQKIAELETEASMAESLSREVDFLSEQIQDANLYIQGLLSTIGERDRSLSEQVALKHNIEKRFEKIGSEVKDKAMLDVKASMLERELIAAHQRIRDLEAVVEEETQKRKQHEDEIIELKSTLEKVHTSLAQIRLKAKREAYGL